MSSGIVTPPFPSLAPKVLRSRSTSSSTSDNAYASPRTKPKHRSRTTTSHCHLDHHFNQCHSNRCPFHGNAVHFTESLSIPIAIHFNRYPYCCPCRSVAIPVAAPVTIPVAVPVRCPYRCPCRLEMDSDSVKWTAIP